MFSTFMWLGGALLLGVFLGMTLMSLLVMSRDSRSDEGLAPHGPEGRTMPNRGRPAATAGSAVRAGGFPETFGVENPIPANDAWEEFDAKASGVR